MPHRNSPASQAQLWRRKRKIEALLPLVGEERRTRMRGELGQLNAILGAPTKVDAEALLRAPTASKGVDGVGGLYFQAESPPGLGRLIRLPFYMTTYEGPTGTVLDPVVVTDGGGDAAAIANPTVVAQVPLGSRTLTGMIFTTPQIEWADLRVVGFQASQQPFMPQFTDPDQPLVFAQTLRPFLLVKDLFIGGGANLFSQEGYIDGAVYTDHVPEFAGLREYPLLTSPSIANVRAAISGQSIAVVGVPSAAAVTFSLNLICEVLDDSEHGRHIPGPYARRDALLRMPSREGGFPRLQ